MVLTRSLRLRAAFLLHSLKHFGRFGILAALGVGVQKMIYLDGDHSRPPKRADEGENREKDWKSWK